jgi:hypothetical protein
MGPNQVKALLTQTADPQACPAELPAAYVAIVGAAAGVSRRPGLQLLVRKR